MSRKGLGWAGRGLLVGTLLAGAGCAHVPNNVLRMEAWQAIQAGDLTTADAKLRLALERDAGDWYANCLLGEVRLRQNKPLEAQFLFEHALAQNPRGEDTPRIVDGLAEALFQQNQFPALAALLQDVASRNKTVRDYLRQAAYLARTGDRDGVNLAFLKAAKLARPTDPSPYLAMAAHYEAIGDATRVVEALRRAYYIQPNDVRTADRLRAHGIVPGPSIALPPLAGAE